MLDFLPKITKFGRILAMITRKQLDIEGKIRISALKCQYIGNILAMALETVFHVIMVPPPVSFLPLR